MDEIGSRLSIVEHTQLEEQLFAVALLDRSGYQRVLHPNPRGGRDGGSDILVRFKRRLFAVAVAFFGPRTQSVDSRILSKFVEDLEKARKADRGSGFIFFTNAYVVDALRIKLVKLGLEEGFEVVEIFDHTWIRDDLQTTRERRRDETGTYDDRRSKEISRSGTKPDQP